MNKAQLNDQIDAILARLVSLDESFVEDGKSYHFIEIRTHPGVDELQIVGNTAGLLHVARKVLEIACASVEGAHHHFDESGLVDECDLPVVVAFKEAEWD